MAILTDIWVITTTALQPSSATDDALVLVLELDTGMTSLFESQAGHHDTNGTDPDKPCPQDVAGVASTLLVRELLKRQLLGLLLGNGPRRQTVVGRLRLPDCQRRKRHIGPSADHQAARDHEAASPQRPTGCLPLSQRCDLLEREPWHGCGAHGRDRVHRHRRKYA